MRLQQPSCNDSNFMQTMQSAFMLPEIVTAHGTAQTRLEEPRNSQMRATSTLSFQACKVPMPKRLFLRNASPSAATSFLAANLTAQKPDQETTKKIFRQAALFKSGAELQIHR